MSKYFESANNSDINVPIAEKESGANEKALRTALEVLPELHLLLKECSSKIDLDTTVTR